MKKILILIAFSFLSVLTSAKEITSSKASQVNPITITINQPQQQRISLENKELKIDIERNWADIAQVITGIASVIAILLSSGVSIYLIRKQSQQQERTLRVSLAENRISWIERVRTAMAKFANDFNNASKATRDDAPLPEITSIFEFKMLFNPNDKNHKKLLSALSEPIDLKDNKQVRRKLLRLELICQFLVRLEWNQAKLELTYSKKDLESAIERQKEETFNSWMLNNIAFKRAWKGSIDELDDMLK